jgi:hypothetical protein
MLGERAQSHGLRGSDGQRGRMSDMTSILHQSVDINVKGGDCSLSGLVFIDVNP